KLQMLETYNELLTNIKYISKIEEIYFKLKLTGMVTIDTNNINNTNEKGAYLKARNKIYTTFYDKNWVEVKKGERLLSASLQQWLESNKHNDFLLRGQALQKALDWQKTQLEITALEREFILASQQAETDLQQQKLFEQQRLLELAQQKAETQTQLALEQKQRAEDLQLLADEQRKNAEIERKNAESERLSKEEKIKSNTRLRKILLGLAASLIFAIIASIFAYYTSLQAQQNALAEQKQRRIAQKQTSLAQDNEQKAKDNAELAKQKQKEAEEQTSIINKQKETLTKQTEDLIASNNEANKQKSIAETENLRATENQIAIYQDQGRRELLSENPNYFNSTLYLSEGYRLATEKKLNSNIPTLKFLLARSIKPIEGYVATLQHQDSVNSASFSPDSNFIVTSSDKTAK
ncbi:MAG: wd-40 repeat containing protein, partial [bacterium]